MFSSKCIPIGKWPCDFCSLRGLGTFLFDTQLSAGADLQARPAIQIESPHPLALAQSAQVELQNSRLGEKLPRRSASVVARES